MERNGKEVKIIFLDDLKQTQRENTKINTEAIREWWQSGKQRGQMFICGDTETIAIINTKGKSTVVDVEGINKYIAEMVRKESVK